MNAALAKLYQDVILSHHRDPHHFGPLPEATHRCQLSNPLCGDEVTIALVLEAAPASVASISHCSFEGHGCAVCRASASLLTDAVHGLSVLAARGLADSLLNFLRTTPKSEGEEGTETPEGLGDLVALSGVREYPSRRRCATLPWEALLKLLETPETPNPER